MFQSTYLISSMFTLVSLFTALGVTLHGTQLDKATLTALTSSNIGSRDGGQVSFVKSDLHTHTDRTSVSQVLHDLDQSSNPRIQPRRSHDKRTLSHRKLVKDRYSRQLS